MNSPFSVRLQLDRFEDRAVPSASTMASCVGQTASVAHSVREDQTPRPKHVHHAECMPAPANPVVPARQALKGWMAGLVTVERTDPRIADLVPRMFLDGTARLQGLGRVTVTGFVQGVGFMPYGQATGMITLTRIGDPKSSVTLNLTGPTTRGGAPLPTQWTATVVSKTGSFSQIQGSLPLTLRITPDPVVPNRIRFHGFA
jgi:hypothetical protein